MNFALTGQIIRDAREKSDLTQAELARRLGMSRATISRLENGTIEELGVRKLALLCDRLGLVIDVGCARHRHSTKPMSKTAASAATPFAKRTRS